MQGGAPQLWGSGWESLQVKPDLFVGKVLERVSAYPILLSATLIQTELKYEQHKQSLHVVSACSTGIPTLIPNVLLSLSPHTLKQKAQTSRLRQE